MSDAAPTCKNHPASPATGSCVSCAAAICDVCTSFALDGHVCVQCKGKELRRRKLRNLALLGVALAGLGALSPSIYRAVHKKVSDMQDGAPAVFRGKLAPLADALDKEPCDRRKIIDFCDELLREGEPRYCLRRTERFFAKCGDYVRLRWLTYEAHKRLSEWDEAIAEATKIIDAHPDDSDYRWWRGIAYEGKGAWAEAAADYEQTIRIEPKKTGIPFNLADMYRKLGRPCDGIFPLEQFTFYHPNVAENARRRLAELYDDPKCSERLGTGKAIIRLGASSRAVTSKVKINNTATGEMLIDTGASSVIVSQAFADRLGLPYRKWLQQRVLLASGSKLVYVGALDEVTLQGVTAKHVECAVIDGMEGVDGLLGLSFLSRFEMKSDPAKGVLELNQKRR